MKSQRRRGAGLKPIECHPAQHQAVKDFFVVLCERRMTLASVARKSGLHPVQISKWKDTHTPTVANMEAALNVLGLRLEVVPIKTDEAPCLADYYLAQY